MVKERPILFSTPMVRALLSGAKTQTRRLVAPGRGQQSWLTPTAIHRVQRFAPSKDGWWTMAVGEPSRIVHCGHEMDGGHIGSVLCPYGVPGDRLWVRETFCPRANGALTIEQIQRPFYLATDEARKKPEPWRWRPSIHMPRWASRITLEVTEVRVQRLQEISEDDARAEGCTGHDPEPANEGGTYYVMKGASAAPSAHAHFRFLWDQINGKRAPWSSNPWVWAISFKRVEG